MNRSMALLFTATLVVFCALAAWLALKDTPTADPGGTATPSVTEPADEAGEGVDGGESSAGERPKAGRTRRPRHRAGGTEPETEEDSSNALAGIVYGPDSAPVGGVSVHLHAAPEDDGMRARMRQLGERFGGRITESTGGSMEDFSEQIEEEGVTAETIEAGMEAGLELLEDGSLGDILANVGRIASMEFEDAPGKLLVSTQTDADGAFRFEDLTPEEDVQIRIHWPGHVRVRHDARVGATDIAIYLRTGVFVDGLVLSGSRVVPDATVKIKGGSMTTGGDGRFHFDGLDTPPAEFLVSAPGYVTSGFRVPITEEGPNDDIRLEMRPAARVRGRVLGPEGAGLEGATVTLGGAGFNPFAMMGMARNMANEDGGTFPGPSPTATTDAGGNYDLDGVTPGQVTLQAVATGYMTERSESLQLTAGAITEGVDFQLGREGVVLGLVTDPRGTPLAGARVKIKIPSEATGMAAMISSFTGGSFRSEDTDEEGRFESRQLREGERDIFVSHQGHITHAGKVQVVPGEEVVYDVALEEGRRLEGRVVAPDETPVEGATVTVKWKGAGPTNPLAAMMTGVDRKNMATFTTDAEGYFVAMGLQTGPYTVTAEAEGFIEAKQTGVAEEATDVLLELGAAATIRGIVIATATNEGLAAAKVFQEGGRRPGGGNPMMAMFQGDPSHECAEDGTFELTGLTAGKYELYGRLRGYADSERLKFDVQEGELVEDVVLALGPAVTLSGRVVDMATGKPVGGALVYVAASTNLLQNAVTSDFTGGEPTAPSGAFSTHADDDGRFEVPDLSPGRHTVHARAEGYAAAKLGGCEAPGPEIVLELGSGGTIQGVVLTADGDPRPDLGLMIQQGFGQSQRMATTDAEGRYEITHVAPGTYMLMLLDMNGPGMMPQGSSITVQEGQIVTRDFRPSKEGTQTLEGTVTRGGKPAESATVILTGGAAGMRMEATDSAGAFTFHDLEPGTYTVMVQTTMMGGGSNSEEVTIEAKRKPRPVRIRLSALDLTGTVVDAATGVGIGGAQVVLLEGRADEAHTMQELMSQQKGQAISNSDGEFKIESVPEGVFVARISAAGYPQKFVEGVRGGGAPVELRLESGVELEVRVLDPGGNPLSGAAVSAEAGGRTTSIFDMSFSGTTNDDGVATLNLAAGSYTLHIQADGFPGESLKATAGGGAVTVTLSAGGTIDVRLSDAEGKPVAGAQVAFLDAAGQPIERRMTMSNVFGGGSATDAAGRLVQAGLPAGQVTIVVTTDADAAPISRMVTVQAGATERVDITAN